MISWVFGYVDGLYLVLLGFDRVDRKCEGLDFYWLLVTRFTGLFVHLFAGPYLVFVFFYQRVWMNDFFVVLSECWRVGWRVIDSVAIQVRPFTSVFWLPAIAVFSLGPNKKRKKN